MWNRLPIFLSLILFLLLYYLRTTQGSWDVKFEAFNPQRQALDQKISSFLPSPQAELLSGILLGQNNNLPPRLKLALRDTSTLHLVVASGQNLSMIGGLFLSLSGLIKRRNAIILSLLAVILYTLLSGLQIPILRASIMFILTALAQFYGRQNDGFRVLILTAGFMLLVNPKWLFQLSFQLSLLATFGVLVVAPILLKVLGKLPVISQDLAVTLAAQVMVTPIIAQNFHQFSIVGLLANLFILWTIPFIMILGALMMGAGIIFWALGYFMAVVVNAFLTYFIYIVSFFSSLPFTWEYVREQSWIVWVGYYMILTGLLLAIKKIK